MPADLDLTVPATTRGLQTALESLEKTCVARRVDGEAIGRVRVVVEELFTNTIKYGYRGECERPVHVSLIVGREVTVTYADEAPAFDPTRWPLPRETSAVGQAGLALLFGLSARVTYRPLAAKGGNHLTIVLTPAQALRK